MMRRWLIIVFVLLLPLRLWAGDAMALAALHSAPAGAHGLFMMEPAHPAAASGAAAPALHDAAHGALHQADPSDPPCPGLSEPGSQHGLCLLCGICHQALALLLQHGVAPPVPPSSKPLPLPSWVLQAALTPELKPPIV